MRLFDRTDSALAVALVAAAIVTFEQPLGRVTDLATAIDLRYHIALFPGLTVLSVAFGLHQFRKRQQARNAAQAAIVDADNERVRSAELDRLVAFGRALGNALEPAATRQVFWRFMPTFACGRSVWMLTRRQDGWDSLVHDHAAVSESVTANFEAQASAALSALSAGDDRQNGVVVDGDFCLPMIVGTVTVGVIGVKNTPEVSAAEKHALCAAAALLAIAIRNSQLLAETRGSSVRDSLTGCYNRAYGNEALAAELRRARRSSRPVAVVMFDVDNLAAINASHGHLTGDAVLEAIGTRVSLMLRGTDVRCRYGGDDFLLILPDTSYAGAEHVAGALLRAVAEIQVPTEGALLTPTISIGVTVAARGETDSASVLADVQAALLRARRNGQNRYVMNHLAQAV